LINFRFDKITYLKNPINIEKLGHMKYICDKIILVTKFENCTYFSKLGFKVEFLDESFFVVYGIDDIHQLNLGPFRN
jgi:hypothetical protein